GASKSQNKPGCAIPTAISEIAGDAHHGRDPYTVADQDHLFGLGAIEDEGSIRPFDLYKVTDFQLIVQPSRNEAVRLAFHRNFDAIAPGRRRCDCIGAPDWDSLRFNAQRQKLSGQVIERNLTTRGRTETKRLHVAGDAFDLGESQLAHPANLS